jgi:hypothetical protein
VRTPSRWEHAHEFLEGFRFERRAVIHPLPQVLLGPPRGL